MEEKKNELKKYSQEKIREYIEFSYVMSLLLLGLIVKEYIFVKENDIFSYNSFLVILFFSTIYFITKYLKNFKILIKPSVKNYGLFAVFTVFITVLIYFNPYINKELYKIYYLFPVILSTVKYGQRFGSLMALFSVANLIYLNFIVGNFKNYDFDVLIIILLFWVAWLIGGFTDLQRKIQNKLEELFDREKELKEEKERGLERVTDLARRLNRVNRELKESQKLFKLNFEKSNIGMIIAEPSGVFIKVNDAVCNMLGYSRKELLGMNFRKVISSDDLPQCKRTYVKMLRGIMDTNNSVLRFKHKRGTTVWGRQNITLAREKADKPLCFLIQIEDITEEWKAKEKIKEQKEKLEYSRLRTQFFAKVSHELRTPLNLIFTTLHMLNKDQKLKENQGSQRRYFRYIKLIRQNSYRLLRLVNNVIDLTKMDTDSFELNLQNCEIVSTIRKIAFSTREYIENSGRIFEFKTEVKERVIACDPFNIERIILNLISNAVKFTHPGDKIKVMLREEEANILITVEDTGIGIEEEKQKLIFEPFRQVDESFTRRAEGSGIGLSIVKSLVELHGGSIDLESISGMGSKFYIKLPIKKITGNDTEESYVNNDLIDRIDVEFSDIYDL